MNKASGGDRIPVELLQILKDDAVKVLHNMPADLENSAVLVSGVKQTESYRYINSFLRFNSHIYRPLQSTEHNLCYTAGSY